MRWGFTHMGHISVEYRRRFGESPSETFRLAYSPSRAPNRPSRSFSDFRAAAWWLPRAKRFWRSGLEAKSRHLPAAIIGTRAAIYPGTTSITAQRRLGDSPEVAWPRGLRKPSLRQ
jgi:hypothetical protein